MQTIIHIGGRKHVEPKEVLFLIADQNYTTLILKNGQQLFVATTLKTLQERLGAANNFFRPNRGNLLNLDFMCRFTDKSITLINEQTFKISRRRQNAFFNILNQN
jgi:DNA-binding LytR/AlgR family response regulator